MNFQDLIIFLMSMVIMSWTWMETGLLITVKKMAKVDSTYPVKITPELSDRVWGFDPTSLKNTLFSIPGILDLNNSDIEPNAINVKRYPGVLGDGVNDDTVGIQLALDEAAGRWVNFPPGNYRITSSLNAPIGSRIIGYGARVFTEIDNFYMFNLNSETVVRGLEIEHSGKDNQDFDARCIGIVGERLGYKENIVIQDCYIHDCGFISIFAQYAKNVSILNTRMIDQGYGGFIGMSVDEVLIDKCHIKGMTYGTPGSSYGVSFTRASISANPGNPLANEPRSNNCTVQNCLVEDNLVWKGLDTHCGENIVFDNNIVLNCHTGIGIVPGNELFAPKNCRVTNNFIKGIGQGSGIIVNGVISSDLGNLTEAYDYNENTVVIGNTMVDCGLEGNNFTGAIRLRDTLNCQIIGNSFINSWVNGITVNNTNRNFIILGNTFQDPRSATLTAFGIQVGNPFNTGIIGNNTFIRRNPALATNVGDRCIRLSSSNIATMSITLVGNHNNGFISNFTESGPTITNFLSSSGGTMTGGLTINPAESSAAEHLRFNHIYRMWADNTGPGSANNRFWLSGPEGGALYFGVRSGGDLNLIEAKATNINLIGAVRAIGGFRSETTISNITGVAGTGNSLPLGIQAYSTSVGLANSLPEDAMTVLNVKMSDSRTFQLALNVIGDMWVRSLSSGSNNIWHRIKKAIGTPQTITTSGSLNNLAILDTTDHLILTNATGLTGIISGLEGRELIIENRNSVSIEFTADSGSSDSANRTAFTYTLLAGEMLKVKYANTKWRRVN
jgi:hypothetical protein